jgi:multidrug efflux pump subunit AcrA (membrane-fusion protein)
VHVEIGDRVEVGSPLIALATSELLLEEAMAAADRLRYAREVEKAQGARQMADMQIAQAREAQAAARLALVRHQIASAEIASPLAGFVVEGELKRNLGAPVRKGDLLLKVARIDETWLEIEFDQADLHELAAGQRGEIAFVGRPDRRYPITLERIDPVAVQREGRTVFLARAQLEGEFEGWWRPGMGGSARIEIGERPILWLMTRRTIRFLRLWLWI